jgi:hypothetical protein
MDTKKIIWKDIPGYEGFYQVSIYGQVKGVDRMVGAKHNYPVKGVLLSPRMGRGGYLDLLLYKDGTCKRMAIHRLVAIVFLPNPENKEMVNHKDGDKTNNRIDNIEWVTRAENMRHAFSNGLVNSSGPRKKPVQMFKDDKKRTFDSITEAAKKIDRSGEALRFALKNNRECNGWHVSYIR